MTDLVTSDAMTATRSRVSSRRRYLMCPPEHFAVRYAINEWMDPAAPVDRDRAMAQWRHLRATYEQLGHQVDVIAAQPGLPDMVFAANAGLAVGNRVLGARFRHPERAAEEPAYRRWFRDAGFTVHEPRHVQEGEGDFLVAGPRILAGAGWRTDPAAHAEAAALFGRPVVTLELVDPRFYHLDTALAVLSDDDVAYYPPAFSPASRALIERYYPGAIAATDADAYALGLNAVSDGRHVVVASQATDLVAALRQRGYEPVPVDVSELWKAGGGIKCCTLEVHR